MHKLIILMKYTPTDPAFQEAWARYINQVEQMPGLKRETVTRVNQVIYGNFDYNFIHELYFESLTSLQQGMASPQGKAAGSLLQSITRGKLVLLFADHKEDLAENLYQL